jgi:MFS family permease
MNPDDESGPVNDAEVVWRLVQGLSGARLVPLGQMFAVNAMPGRHTQATSLWAIGFIAANVISPILAGYLIEAYGWPWIFYASIPVSLACLLAAWFFVPSIGRQARRMNWFGFLSLIVGLGMLQLVPARGERLDWFDSPVIVIETLAAGILLYLFAAHTRFARDPFIARELLLNSNFMLALISVFLVGCVLYLPVILLPAAAGATGWLSAGRGRRVDAVRAGANRWRHLEHVDLVVGGVAATRDRRQFHHGRRHRFGLGADEHDDAIAFAEAYPGAGVRAVLPGVRRW